MRTLGLITYPLYLTHNVIGSAIIRTLVEAGLDATAAVWIALGMRLTSKFVAISAATLLLCAAAAIWISRSGDPARATAASGEIRPVWTETDWPFAADPWGKGKAFRCKAADCGGEVLLYVRAKLGFCNCATGVADDGDLEQMGDLVLIGKATPTGAGREIIVGPMRGRSRAYRIEGNPNTALSLAFNQRCDMFFFITV